MKHLLIFSMALAGALLISGCSANKVFEPEEVIDEYYMTQEYDYEPFMQHMQGITFKEGKILSAEGFIEKIKLPAGYAYLGENSQKLIAADNGGKLLLIDKTTHESVELSFENRILSASLENGVLAFVDVKNEMYLYDVASSKLLNKFSGAEVMAIDARLAAPKFYEGLVFFPTLDGKIQIYSEEAKRMIRTMSVSTVENFNNIIFFELVGQKIIAATGSAVYLFAKDSIKKEMPVRSLFVSGEHLIVLQKDGRVSRLDMQLKTDKQMKFTFAYFLGGLAKEGAVYIIEKEGFVIKIDPEFKKSSVYELGFESEAFFTGKDRFYFSDGSFLPN